jgi:hypothetical protein
MTYTHERPLVIKLTYAQQKRLTQTNETIRVRRKGVIYYLGQYRDLPISVQSWGGTEYTNVSVLDDQGIKIN